MFEQEIWKDIKGYEELYQVSNMGRIKSLKRKIKKQKWL
ncbi:MAG: NUMOD4 domain-containing protein [Candidatus Onthovivens sp.]|nr:NUMOD4 domain-containing protein [Candidatus Onthovivens sp.]